MRVLPGAAPASAEKDASLELARQVAESVLDPELPVVSLADLGVLRRVEALDGDVVVTITPTYSGCPAMEVMRADLLRSLAGAGLERVRVVVELSPPWSTDWITPAGREALRRHGVSPPGPAPERARGRVALTLTPTRRHARCPRCGSSAATLVSDFGSTACKALYTCSECLEPFEHVKEI